MLRFFDFILAALILCLCLPMLLLLMVIGFLDTGLPFFRQKRVGRGRKAFVIVKLRTMKSGTASMATHLTDASAVTPFGRFLRRTKLDELPQLWNVLKGEMSLVGPRPCLFNQGELIEARAQRGIYDVRPGVTGLAQLRGIDMATPELLAETDREMLETLGVVNYFRYLILTVLGRGAGDRVRN